MTGAFTEYGVKCNDSATCDQRVLPTPCEVFWVNATFAGPPSIAFALEGRCQSSLAALIPLCTQRRLLCQC